MHSLVVFRSTNDVEDFLYLYPLIKNNPEEFKVIFADGIPSDMCPHAVCSMSEDSLLYKFSFETTKRGYLSNLGKYINNNDIENIIIFSPNIGQHHINQLLEHCPAVNVIFISNNNIEETKQAVQALETKDITFVATTDSIGQRLLGDIRYFYIHGAVTYPEFADNHVRTNYRINKNEKIIGIIGNVDIMPINNIIAAARTLKVGIIICGYGNTIKDLCELVSTNKWPVVVVPFIPWARGNWYEAFDCFLNVCDYSGFPVFALEAALCKCPIVSTPVGDLYSILGAGRAVFVTRSTDSIVQGLTSINNINTDDVASFVRNMYSLNKYLNNWNELFEIVSKKKEAEQ